MAIKIKSLNNIARNYTQTNYLYKDLALDIAPINLITPGFNNSVVGRDIRVSYDLQAISNSLANLFNTIPGQRFLFPEYGADLRRFLFLPITEGNGQIIGNAIFRSIQIFEPRVIPKQVDVELDPDNSQYIIIAAYEVPIFNTTDQTAFEFNIRTQSFIMIPKQ